MPICSQAKLHFNIRLYIYLTQRSINYTRLGGTGSLYNKKQALWNTFLSCYMLFLFLIAFFNLIQSTVPWPSSSFYFFSFKWTKFSIQDIFYFKSICYFFICNFVSSYLSFKASQKFNFGIYGLWLFLSTLLILAQCHCFLQWYKQLHSGVYYALCNFAYCTNFMLIYCTSKSTTAYMNIMF
jgi:hypothetical protein